jgi:protoporphyrinogen oxidase
MGGKILTGISADRIVANSAGGVTVTARQQRMDFDCVVSTIPSGPLARVAPELHDDYRSRLLEVQYMGMVCTALVLRRKLTPYYCTNLTDDLPFTGIIEMTNLISPEETQGRHLVYLPKYTAPNDPLFNAGDDQVWQTFRDGLQRVIPDLKENDIEQRFIFRERLVQPIPVMNYSALVPNMQTSVKNLFLANTTQIVNSTLNNNEMVKISRTAVDLVLRACATAHGRVAQDSAAEIVQLGGKQGGAGLVEVR